MAACHHTTSPFSTNTAPNSMVRRKAVSDLEYQLGDVDTSVNMIEVISNNLLDGLGERDGKPTILTLTACEVGAMHAALRHLRRDFDAMSKGYYALLE